MADAKKNALTLVKLHYTICDELLSSCEFAINNQKMAIKSLRELLKEDNLDCSTVMVINAKILEYEFLIAEQQKQISESEAMRKLVSSLIEIGFPKEKEQKESGKND